MLSAGLLLEACISPCCESRERWKESLGAKSINPVLCAALHRSHSILKEPQDNLINRSWLPRAICQNQGLLVCTVPLIMAPVLRPWGGRPAEQLATLASLAADDLLCTRDMPRWWREAFFALWEMQKEWKQTEKSSHSVIKFSSTKTIIMVVT